MFGDVLWQVTTRVLTRRRFTATTAKPASITPTTATDELTAQMPATNRDAVSIRLTIALYLYLWVLYVDERRSSCFNCSYLVFLVWDNFGLCPLRSWPVSANWRNWFGLGLMFSYLVIILYVSIRSSGEAVSLTAHYLVAKAFQVGSLKRWWTVFQWRVEKVDSSPSRATLWLKNVRKIRLVFLAWVSFRLCPLRCCPLSVNNGKTE